MFESPAEEVLRHRWNEPLKFLPVAFVSFLILGLYVIYTFFHCLPLLADEDASIRWRGLFLCIIFHISTGFLITCYMKCILIHPGTVPDKEVDSRWMYSAATDSQSVEALPPGLQVARETKRSGDRRVCKWCQKYKPDRCHHCRVCRLCILKMDHHCPWIYNCVGFHNHKYFFLLLMYSTFNCHLIVWTMYPSVVTALVPTEPFIKMFCLLFGEALAAFLCLLLSFFYTFHIWLMLRAMTTIEFCEKSVKRTGSEKSTYDLGYYHNVKAVLGENFLLWFLPCSPPLGDGLIYALNEETPLLKAGSESPENKRRFAPRWRRGSPQAGTGSTSDLSPQDSRSCSPDPFGSGRRNARDASIASYNSNANFSA